MAYKRPELERYDDGRIKPFSVPDAHTLMVSCRSSTNPAKIYFQEDMVLFSLDELDQLDKLVDPYDGYLLAEKWVINYAVIKSLKSRGDAARVLPPFVYTYMLRKTIGAGQLKHKG